MIKSIIKEIIIIILLLLAIVLVFGVILYDYNPNLKTISSKIEKYNLSENVQQELKETLPNESEIITTYTVESSDLKRYEKNAEYDKGKANPFEKYTEESSNEETTTATGEKQINSKTSTFPTAVGK